MPNGGSVNQIESSDLTTMSLGELSGLPSNLSISTLTLPSYSVRVTRRVSCSQVTSRPWRSRVLPLALFDGPSVNARASRRLVPAQDAIVGNVAPKHATRIPEVDRALG